MSLTNSGSRTSNPLPAAYALGLFAVVAFGATLPVTRIALGSFGPEFLTFARAIIATGLAVASLLVLKARLFDQRWRETLLAGFFLIFAFPGAMAIAMQTVPASHGGVVLGFLPLATAIIARLIADETPSPAFWLLSIAGAVIVVAFILVRAAEPSGDTGIGGYVWLVVAGLSAAGGYVIFGKLSRNTPGWIVISRALVINLPLTLAGFFWSFADWPPTPTTAEIAALLYLGLFSMFLAFCAWNAALAMGGIARIGQLQLLQVFVTIAVSAWLVGESVDALTLGAAIAITVLIAASRRA